MGRITLTATSHNEKLLLAHLEKNASEDLAARINKGAKTLQQCWSYITSEARKQANHGCACIEDTTVYGWCMHFFEEDGIDGSKFDSKNGPHSPYAEKPAENTAPQKVTPVKQKKPKVEDISLQLSMDFG